MLLVFGLACVLGAAFNNASPLGLHETARLTPWTNQTPRVAAPLTNATQVLPKMPATNSANDGTSNRAPATNPSIAAAANVPAPTQPGTPPKFNEVTWAQAKEWLADGRTVLVDARLANSFQAGHIPNAVSLPVLSEPSEISAFRAKYPPPATPLIIYCSGETCHLSHALATILSTQHGYTNVSVMPGGFNEYLRVTAESK